MTCTACGQTGHNRNSAQCPAKSVNQEFIRRLINEEIEKSGLGKVPNPEYVQQLHRQLYRVTKHAYEARRNAVVRDGHMILSCDENLAREIGIDMSDFTALKLDQKTFREWLGSYFEFPEKRGKGVAKNVSKAMLSSVRIRNVFYRSDNRRSNRKKFSIEFDCKANVAIALNHKRTVPHFKGNSLDWYSLLSRECLIKLNSLKQQKVIGNWFFTPRANQLILLPPENDRQTGEQGERRKDGVKLNNPELDLFIKPERFSEFVKLKNPNAYISMDGQVRTVTMDSIGSDK